MAVLRAIFAALIASAHGMPLPGRAPILDATAVTKKPTPWHFVAANRTVAVMASEPLLIPDQRYTWPVHIEILENLLKNLVDAQKRLVDAQKPFCNLPPSGYSSFNQSTSSWQVLVDNFPPYGKKLLKSQYLEAVASLRAPITAVKKACTIREMQTPHIQDRVFEILMDNILVVGLIFDTSGYDGIPAYLRDPAWDVVNDLLDIATFEFVDSRDSLARTIHLRRLSSASSEPLNS